jgi:CHASE2 domain-containing sensor protein
MRTRVGLADAARVIAVAAAAAVAIATNAPIGIQHKVADAFLWAAAEHPPALPAEVPDVALLAIDAASLHEDRPWPWSADVWRLIVRRLDAVGARTIVLVVDPSGDDDANQERLAAAIRGSGRTVLARLATTGPGADAPVRISSALTRSAAAVGSADLRVDGDGVVRALARATGSEGEPLPSLARAALETTLGESLGKLRAGDEQLVIDYRRARPRFPVLSAAELLADPFEPERFAERLTGRIVLVGPTAPELSDGLHTPLADDQPTVWIQAVALRTLAARHAGAGVLRSPSLGIQMAGAALISLIAFLLGTASRRRSAIGLGSLAVATGTASFLLLAQTGWLVDPVVPLGVIATHGALAFESVRRRSRQTESERELALSALFHVQRSGQSDPLELSLALLGDLVDASGVALFRYDEEGALTGGRLEWRAEGDASVGDPETAAQVGVDQRVRIFHGVRPGAEQGSGSAVYAPLPLGELETCVLVVERERNRPFSEATLRAIAAQGAQLGLSVRTSESLQDLRETLRRGVESLAAAIEARDGYTNVHCRRLSELSGELASRVGLDDREIEGIRLGAVLHDIGKLGVRDEILLKPGRLTASERLHMERHPDVGRSIVQSIPGVSKTTLDVIMHHHEWWDGSGYPTRLRGTNIPIGARIVAIVDAWDALLTARSYKAAYTVATVRTILMKAAGSQFDPELIELFLEILEEREGEIPVG